MLPYKIRTAPGYMIRAFERRYLNDHTQEHAMLFDASGNLVVERDGVINRVEFTPQELERACMGLLTHNHPKGRPLSVNDLSVGARYGLTIRATGINADGSPVTYIVRFPNPSRELADTLFYRMKEEEARAHEELAFQAEFWTDEQWLQRGRDLALSRLANEYKFMYSRVSLVAEMNKSSNRAPKNDEQGRLDVLVTLDNQLKENIFGMMHASLARLLLRNGDGSGRVSPGQNGQVRREAGAIIQRTMLGIVQQDGTLSPYRVQHERVIPNSPYFKVLWAGLVASAAAGVERQARIMRKYLPEDLRHAFEMATIDPFISSVAETKGDTSPHIPQFDPLHQWLGPDNRTLSDRIWNATGDMRRRLDLYLQEAIASGRPIEVMSAELEEFLVPGRKLIRYSGPWGTDLSFDAMRLARAEVSAAYHRADYAAAQLNPFVEMYQPFTSPTHKEVDDCDAQRDNGPYPKSDPSHLSPFHALCLCSVRWIEVSKPDDVVESLRDRVKQGLANASKTLADLIGPLSKRFIELLFRGKS